MFKIFKKLSLTDWLMALINVVLIVSMVYFELKIPDYMTEITQIIGTTGDIRGIIFVGLKMLLCALLGAIFSVGVGFFAARISASLGYRLRGMVFSKVQDFSLAEIKKFSTASLITRSTNDISQVQMFVSMSLQLAIKSPVMALWAIFKILNKSWQWSVATLCAILFISIILCLIILIAVPRFKRVQLLNDNLTKVSRENLTGVRVIRAFNAEGYQEDKFNKANDDLTDNQLFINKIMSLIDPTMNFIMSALPLSIYLIGAFLISNKIIFESRLEVFSNMVVFSSYAIQVVLSFIMLVFIFMMLPRASVSATRLNEVLDTKSTIVDGIINVNAQEVGTVEFVDVAFKYPDAEECVIENINLKINRGEVVAFIGSTGSGKSTLINLVPRLYDATSGSVLVDGVNVKDYKLEDLNSKIGYISQRPVVFSGSVEYNVALGSYNGQKPGKEAVSKALSVSQSNFIYKFENGLNENLNQGGKNISGGQKQRISIARALARKPEILIFDDSFSALDYKTDKKLRRAIKEEFAGVTMLIVAQRIGTIKDADKIFVLNDGRIVGEGTHASLMENCDVYKEIALSQLSKEELD